MNSLSQIGINDPQRHTLTRAASVENLVAALRETESAVRESIRAEEHRTSLSDPSDPCYSMLAHAMRQRAGNLQMTIATLVTARQAA